MRVRAQCCRARTALTAAATPHTAQRMMEMAEEARTETLSDTLALRLAASDAIAQLDAQQQQLDAPARPSASATLQDSLLGAGSPLAAGAAAAGGARGPAHALRTASAGGNENAGALAAKLARALETTLARQTQVMRTLQQRVRVRACACARARRLALCVSVALSDGAWPPRRRTSTSRSACRPTTAGSCSRPSAPTSTPGCTS